jgi:hypothetical protein
MVNVELTQAESLGSLLERSGTTTYVLGILYLLSFIYACRRFVQSYTRLTRWDIPRLFLASILFGLLVRTFSFITLAILAFQNVNVDAAENSNPATPASAEQLFYERVLAVLFNVGDWATISTYLLLVVVWVEIMLRGRKHLYSSASIRRYWMIAYLTINISLYLVQIGLYGAVFTTEGNPQTILDATYLVIAFLNLFIPFVLFVASCVYTILFAGFPYRNDEAKRSFSRMNRLVLGWTVGRCIWAGMAVVAAQESTIQALAAAGAWLFALVTGTVFVVAELVPFLASQGSDVLQLFNHHDELLDARASNRLHVDESIGQYSAEGKGVAVDFGLVRGSSASLDMTASEVKQSELQPLTASHSSTALAPGDPASFGSPVHNMRTPTQAYGATLRTPLSAAPTRRLFEGRAKSEIPEMF